MARDERPAWLYWVPAILALLAGLVLTGVAAWIIATTPSTPTVPDECIFPATAECTL